VDLVDDPLEQRAVLAPAERSVEVDEVDPLGARVRPLGGRIHRVAVAGLAARLALGEAHGLAVGHIDRGKEDESGRAEKIGHVVPRVGPRKRRGCTRG